MNNSKSSISKAVAIDRADSVPIVSLDINIVELQRVIGSFAKLRSDGGGYVCLSTVHMVMEANDNPAYRAKVNSADLVIPDGRPLVWIQKLTGHLDATQIRAKDLMVETCLWASENDVTVGFYGGMPEVIEKIKSRAAREFPHLRIVYSYSPPFRAPTGDEDRAIVRAINDESPDILFVGLGCPKQEMWMADHRNALTCVMIGVGAAFDFYAGSVKESPAWLSRIGLEWLYRLIREPKRLWRRYLLLNPRFVFLAVSQLVRSNRESK